MTALENSVSTDSKSTGDGDTTIDSDQLAELAGPPDQDAEDLDIGEIFELLKNERRRRVIRFLKEQDDYATTLDVLAEYIASLENDVEVEQLSSSQRKRVYIALYQCHLPKMDHFGVIDFNKNRGTIELRNTTLLDPYLADPVADTDEDRREIAVAGAVAAVALVGSTGIGGFAVMPAVFWTGITAIALLWVAAN